MKVGIPKEIKNNEFRVSTVPSTVEELVNKGHTVLVQKGAGEGSGIEDESYIKAGAKMVGAEEAWGADLVCKVKEPMSQEYKFMRKGQVIYTYFHFASNQELTMATQKSGCTAIAYETIRNPDGELPLLTPMSEIAGKMAVQEGAKYLERAMGGRGVLLGGVPGVAPAEVIIIGGGVVGTCAAKVAAGLGARVTILDVSLKRLRYLDDILPANCMTLHSNLDSLRTSVARADLLIGAVLLEGAKAPTLVNRQMVSQMKNGSVIVDVAVDQGGCVETTKPTTHENPTFVVDGVLHYCVANMPGAVSRSSTYALTNATAPYLIALAQHGWQKACQLHQPLKLGVNMHEGDVTNKAVAETFKLEFKPLGF
ncbi:MAG: alanine dehydrogenase [Planctomycetota bacterium]